jgi:nitrate/nitrite-specific signal transduction histidine kinase
MLADAFSEFISASSLLEASYRDLQQEVAHLGLELAERNAALTAAWRKTTGCARRCSR